MDHGPMLVGVTYAMTPAIRDSSRRRGLAVMHMRWRNDAMAKLQQQGA
jgi:hypothetical protein